MDCIQKQIIMNTLGGRGTFSAKSVIKTSKEIRKTNTSSWRKRKSASLRYDDDRSCDEAEIERDHAS